MKLVSSPIQLSVAAGHHHIILPNNDKLGELRRALISKLPRKAPSSLGEPLEFGKYQQGTDGPVFYFNRPPSAAPTTPVTLLHPIFGQFVDDCEAHVPIKEDNAFAFALSTAMSEVYGDEKDRVAKFHEVLANHSIFMSATKFDGTKYGTDGDMQCNGYRYVISEVKLEIGSKGAEPLFQGGWYYQESMKKPSTTSVGSPLPCLLIYLFGSFTALPTLRSY